MLLAVLVEVDPRWDGASLLVNGRLRDDPDGTRKIMLCLSQCWRWRDWSDTRWLGSGVSGQQYVRSQVCGADAAVRMVLANRWTGKYYISGYKKAGPAERRLLAVAALCTVPPVRCGVVDLDWIGVDTSGGGVVVGMLS